MWDRLWSRLGMFGFWEDMGVVERWSWVLAFTLTAASVLMMTATVCFMILTWVVLW